MDGRFEAPLLQAIAAVAGDRRHARALARGVVKGRRSAIDRVQNGTGSCIRLDDGGIHCMEIELAAGVIWNAGAVVMRAEMLPETVKSALPGRPLDEVIAHPLIDGDMIVTRVVPVGELDRIEVTGHVRGIDRMAPTVWRPPDREIRVVTGLRESGRIAFHVLAMTIVGALTTLLACLGHPVAAGVFAMHALMLYGAAIMVATTAANDAALSQMEQNRRQRLTAPSTR